MEECKNAKWREMQIAFAFCIRRMSESANKLEFTER